MMKLLVLLVCQLAIILAAPVPGSDSNEEKVAAHANEALRWMEIYRLYQQQGLVGNPFLPAAAGPAVAAVVDAARVQPAHVPPPAAVADGDASEETEDGNPAPAAPLNSDEVEEAGEAEEVEAAEAGPAVTEAAPVEPGADPAAVEPAVVDIPVDAAPVDAAAEVDVPPVDVVPVDIAPTAPEVAVDAGAGPLAAEIDMTGVVADAAAL